MYKLCALALLLLWGATSCSTGSGFVPSTGNFAGTLETAEGSLGPFTFSFVDGGIAGTGTLNIDGNIVPVNITGLVGGMLIDGEVRNVNLGGGEFDGQYLDATHASGTFTYIDAAETISLSGTWVAVVSP